MNRTHTACWCLIASAIVLSAMLVGRWSDSVRNDAEAALVIARDNFTLLTAQTRSGEESLFILDNRSGSRLIYDLNVGRKRMELVAGQNLDQVFSGVGGGGGGGDRDRRTTR